MIRDRDSIGSMRGLPLLILIAGTLLPGAGTLAADVPGVIITRVQETPVADPIEALGTLTANESVSLTATVTETVNAIHFDDGDRVEKGQVLAEMTSREEHAQLEEARATVSEAQRQFQRIKSLEAEGTAAKALLDERQRDWETARARLNGIESRLADRLIKAPFAGVVGLRDLSVGALVQPGDLITTLDDDSVMKLEFPVPETSLAALQPGLEIIARAGNFPDQQFSGVIKAIDSRIDPVTRSIRVRAMLPNPERVLKPGQLLQVTLLNRPRKALMIPEEALLPQGTQHFIYLVDGASKVVKREIRIGARRPGQVEVLEGLAIGDQVITHGMTVQPGQTVQISAVDDGSKSLSELLRSLPGSRTTE
jgi:membrane fusion protein (multidrug efflux system)